MPGFIDPTLTPANQEQAAMVRRALKRGLSVRRLRPDSEVIAVVGPGVHVVVAGGLAHLTWADLKPPDPRR